MQQERKRTIVIGGGITGLAASYRLMREAEKQRSPLDIVMLEASERVGGVLQTTQRDGFLIEHGPDAFISTKPWAKTLCEELGVADKLIGTNPHVRRSFVARRRKLHPVPEGFYMMAPGAFLPFLKSPIFSWSGKLRMMFDFFIPRGVAANPPGVQNVDESVADFVRRRLGNEAFERMAQPMIGGIYTSDAENLSLRATFPRFLEMEQTHGSIIKALLARKQHTKQTTCDTSGPRYSLFLSFISGMQTLVDALVTRLQNAPSCAEVTIRLASRVMAIQQLDTGKGWQVSLASGERLDADSLCIAIPAPRAREICRPVSAVLAKKLDEIPYASSVTVNLAFRRADIGHPLNGMGFVVPATENLSLIGCSFSSVKFAARAPEEHVLLRAFVKEDNGSDDSELTQRVLKELTRLLRLTKEPLFSLVSRHPRAMAQYLVGHQGRVSEIERLAKDLPGFALAGNAYHGIGIPDCIHSGEQAARKLLELP